MANPLDAFKDLKTWQKVAIAVGSAGVVGLVVWQKMKAKTAVPATPPTATQAATSGGAAAGEIEDPATGQYYPDDSVDPETGLTYADEITEYGSVSAADSEFSGAQDQAVLQGETPEEYDEQTGVPYEQAGAAVTTNAQWMAEVETGLSEQGYSASDIGQGLAAYFAGKPLGTSSDGTSLYTMMNLAVSEYGPPPTGSYPLLLGPATPGGGGGSAPPSVPQVTVPDTVGQAQEAAYAIITAAGLKPATTTPPVKGETLYVTSQKPAGGTKAASGATVTVTSGRHTGAPAKTPAKSTDGKPAAKQ
jgi:hypothetical protein